MVHDSKRQVRVNRGPIHFQTAVSFIEYGLQSGTVPPANKQESHKRRKAPSDSKGDTGTHTHMTHGV